MKIAGIIMLTLVLLTGATAAAQSGTGTISLHFEFQFNGKPVEAGTSYKTAVGESIQFDQIRFYAGHIGAVTPTGKTATAPDAKETYRLIDSKDSTSLTVEIPVSASDSLGGIHFTIGVDSADQVRGARSGALDPLKGMYWTWNSGYVAVKIEARSPSTPTTHEQVEYHLGGYRKPDAALTSIELRTNAPFYVAAGGKVDLTIPIDLALFFPRTFSIKELPAFMTPGPMVPWLMQQFRNCFLRIGLGNPGI